MCIPIYASIIFKGPTAKKSLLLLGKTPEHRRCPAHRLPWLLADPMWDTLEPRVGQNFQSFGGSSCIASWGVGLLDPKAYLLVSGRRLIKNTPPLKQFHLKRAAIETKTRAAPGVPGHFLGAQKGSNPVQR